MVHDSVGGLQGSYEPWLSTDFTLRKNGAEIEIPAIELRQAELSIADEANYFFYSGLTKSCPNSPASVPPMRQAETDFYNYATEKVCRGNDDDLVPQNLVEIITIYAPHSSAVVNAIQALNKKYHITQ